jgi:SAM-dependent methyltransferase
VVRHPVYGASAPALGWVPAPRYVLRRARILAWLDALPRDERTAGSRALEVGCGAGALLFDLVERGYSAAAVETAPAASALARALHRDSPDVAIYDRPQEDWEGAFDLVLAFEVLEHIEDDAGALAQWRGWLRPGGRLLLSVPARMARWTASDVFAGHMRRYERAGLLALFERSGFAVERSECYGFPLSNVTERVRAWVHARALRRATLAAGAPPTPAKLTEGSGIERGFESRLYPLQASWPGVQLFRAFFWLQERFLDRELGTGYLVLARKR